MQEPAIPLDEVERLDVLAGCRIVDTPPEASFDDIAMLAAQICAAPIALVSLVTSDRQWFKARVGIAARETSRKVSFCAHALEATAPFVVPDALADERFRDNPHVLGDPHVRFYAGVPLRVGEGSAVGTLCVLDHVPRSLTPVQLAAIVTQRRQIASLQQQLAPPVRLGAGRMIASRWRLGATLGKGGVGTVFRATPHDGGPDVAIKFLLPSWQQDAGVVARFAREARTLMRIDSPHVVRVLDVGNLDPLEGGLPFIVTELLTGRDLDRTLRERGRGPWGQAASWIVDACVGLAEAHDRGVVHRDVKPANLFLADEADGSTTLKVLDFGLAKDASDEGDTTMREVLGTIAYMAPEQLIASRDADARSDVWALGAVLYELVAGTRAFLGESDVKVASAVLHGTVPPLDRVAPDVPHALSTIVARCLRSQPAERFADARELGAALRGVLG